MVGVPLVRGSAELGVSAMVVLGLSWVLIVILGGRKESSMDFAFGLSGFNLFKTQSTD